jgi:hypothetical protein
MKRATTVNKVLTIGGLNGFVSTEVQNSTFALLLKFTTKIPHTVNTKTVSINNTGKSAIKINRKSFISQNLKILTKA